MVTAEIYLARLLLFYRKIKFSSENLLKVGFISVYKASIFAIYQMIFLNSLTFVKNLGKKLYT